jgi:hypothetical protein
LKIITILLFKAIRKEIRGVRKMKTLILIVLLVFIVACGMGEPPLEEAVNKACIRIDMYPNSKTVLIEEYLKLEQQYQPDKVGKYWETKKLGLHYALQNWRIKGAMSEYGGFDRDTTVYKECTKGLLKLFEPE